MSAWLGLAWLGLAWLGLAWLGLAWLGLAWLGLACLVLAWLARGGGRRSLVGILVCLVCLVSRGRAGRGPALRSGGGPGLLGHAPRPRRAALRGAHVMDGASPWRVRGLSLDHRRKARAWCS